MMSRRSNPATPHKTVKFYGGPQLLNLIGDVGTQTIDLYKHNPGKMLWSELARSLEYDKIDIDDVRTLDVTNISVDPLGLHGAQYIYTIEVTLIE